MRNMSKKTWKLRVRSCMTEMQKLDILLKHAKVPHTYGRRWPEMDRPDNQEFLPGGRHDGGEQIIAYDPTLGFRECFINSHRVRSPFSLNIRHNVMVGQVGFEPAIKQL